MKKRIKIKSRTLKWDFLWMALLAITFIGVLVYPFLISFSENYPNTFNIVYLVFIILTSIFVLCAYCINKRFYLANIFVDDDLIILQYKVRNKITGEKIIQKANIKSFNLDVDVAPHSLSLFSVTHAKYTLFIELHKGFYVKLEDYIENAWFESDHEFIFKILDVAWSIPGFNLNIKYGDEEFKQEIQYYKIHGRKMPFFEKIRKQISDMPFFIKILFIWVLAPFLYAIYLFIKMSIISK